MGFHRVNSNDVNVPHEIVSETRFSETSKRKFGARDLNPVESECSHGAGFKNVSVAVPFSKQVQTKPSQAQTFQNHPLEISFVLVRPTTRGEAIGKRNRDQSWQTEETFQ